MIYVPTLAIASFLFDDNKAAKPKTKIGKTLDRVVIIAVSVFVLWYSYRYPYNAEVWNVVWIAAIVIFMFAFKGFAEKIKDKKNQKERSIFITIVYSCLIITPIAFIALTGADTVNEASQQLEQAGYQEIQYIDNITNDRYFKVLFKSEPSIKQQENNFTLGAYIFTASDNNTTKAVAISCTTGEILAEEVVRTGSEVAYFIKMA